MNKRHICLEPLALERFLDRPLMPFTTELNLTHSLTTVLDKADQFVPSADGFILLDDPLEKQSGRTESLTVIAAFGERAARVLGRRVPADAGIAGDAYATGRAHRLGEPTDLDTVLGINAELGHRASSVVAIPIRIGNEVCGVLELVNRQGASAYSEEDCTLLEIFADYVSISVQNVLDGRHAQEIAKRDDLTDLYNDRYLHIALAETIEVSRHDHSQLALLFVDLDFFKRVNDSHGHLAGSQVLHEVGDILKRCLANHEAILARYGGDEFVVILPRSDLDAAVDRAEDIRSMIEAQVFCEGAGAIQKRPLHLRGLTCSVGVATLERHVPGDLPVEDAKTTLLHLADAAMYVAKETGRNRTAVAGEPVRRRRLGPTAASSPALAER